MLAFTLDESRCAVEDSGSDGAGAMLNLNHILLFLALVSPLVLLARTLRARVATRGWTLAALLVLAATAGVWLLRRDVAGFVGGAVWFFLLLVPSIGLRRLATLSLQQRYTSARRLAAMLRCLHPADGWIEQPRLLRALELAQAGRADAARAQLAPLRSNDTAIGRQAIAQTFRMAGEWEELIAWCRQTLTPAVRQRDVALMPHYLRALGETGALDQLVLEYAAWEQRLKHGSVPAATIDLCWMVVLAFCGRARDVARLLESSLAPLPADVKEFWLGTAEFAGGLAAGRARLERLRANTADESIRPGIERRLERAHAGEPPQLGAGSEALLDRIASAEGQRAPVLAPGGRITPAVLALILMNLAVFAAELALGGSTNPDTLLRLGALEPGLVLANGEYWRTVSALFLHFGPLHLGFNLYALYLFGPPLERATGTVRFSFIYFLAGLGSSGGVVWLRHLGWTRADFLVGASGSVMGIIGASAGLLLRERGGSWASGRLRNLLLIVAMQTAFDLSTPQVSMAAHLCGLITGAAAGYLLGGKSRGGRRMLAN